LVEQRTENPCVPGSNPGGTTKKRTPKEFSFFVSYCKDNGLIGLLVNIGTHHSLMGI
jgi:hypothetical protein